LKTYLILDFTIINLEKFMEYVEKIPTYLNKHCGKYLVEGMTPNILEGDWNPGRIVVLEFDTQENAQDFLSDSEVKELFKIRHENTRSNIILVNGGSWRDEVSQHA
jgi:uncharacterized protein (DUF1330 family)